MAQLKLFFRDSNDINRHKDFSEDKVDQKGDDCISHPIKAIIQPLHKKPVKNSQKQPESKWKTMYNIIYSINGWDKLPEKTVEKILIKTIKITISYARYITTHVIGKYHKFMFPILENIGKLSNLSKLFISNQMIILRSQIMERSIWVYRVVTDFWLRWVDNAFSRADWQWKLENSLTYIIAR